MIINDRRQKQAALAYVISKGWFPQIELIIQPPRSANRKPYEITDIDVYGAAPDELSGYRSIVFDCKGGRQASAVTRAMWLKGLMTYLDAEWGICVLADQKMIPSDHREAAGELGVSLMTLSEFDVFAQATDGSSEMPISHLANIDHWGTYIKIGEKYPQLQAAVDFSRGKYWALASGGDAVRHSITLLRQLRGELDPAKREHLVAFGDVLALFLFGLAKVGHRLFRAYLQPASRNELDAVLLPYMYGGRESYSLVEQLTLLIERRPRLHGQAEIAFPEWDSFLQLTRSLLDAPMQALAAPLLAREVAWSFFESSPGFEFAQMLARSKRQTGKFCLQAAKYLGTAAKLPPEFADQFSRIFLMIQVPD